MGDCHRDRTYRYELHDVDVGSAAVTEGRLDQADDGAVVLLRPGGDPGVREHGRRRVRCWVQRSVGFLTICELWPATAAVANAFESNSPISKSWSEAT